MQPSASIQRSPLGLQSTVSAALRAAFELMQLELTSLRKHSATQRAQIELLQREVSQAASMQRQLMPLRPPRMRGADLQIIHRPASTVSGDFVDCFRADADRVIFSLADACGHGMAAGLLSAFVQRAFRDAAVCERNADPEQTLLRINQILCDADFRDGSFVSGVHATFDEATRVFRWARAGAPCLMLLRKGLATQTLESSGLLLGVESAAQFENGSCQLQSDDVVLVYTDGLEALVSSREKISRFEDTSWYRALTTAGLNDRMGELQSWLDSSFQQELPDDVTAIILRIH